MVALEQETQVWFCFIVKSGHQRAEKTLTMPSNTLDYKIPSAQTRPTSSSSLRQGCTVQQQQHLGVKSVLDLSLGCYCSSATEGVSGGKEKEKANKL